ADARTERVPARMASTDSEMPVRWALAGLGLAQKSLWEVESYMARGLLRTVLEQWEPDPISFFAIHPVSTAHSRKIGLFIDELMQHPPPMVTVQ
ncbi:LysR substrate-binding domain-containing protein, partial [Komagataeibacter kakiaceti]|uniref:LysR substrate-binding domain-containing protein n=1 Tax=Komagataeibacter kakiaceti TaxID=943261 RepID=UPI00054ED51B